MQDLLHIIDIPHEVKDSPHQADADSCQCGAASPGPGPLQRIQTQ